VVVDLEAYINCQYGYDVRCEVVGSLGTVSVENPALTPISLNGQRGNPVPADWRTRFGDAYRAELQAWITSLGPVCPKAGRSTPPRRTRLHQ
jgi:myo-inositol 2-dehydrogenase / D-chiro-inositol 1-dehydrogenase